MESLKCKRRRRADDLQQELVKDWIGAHRCAEWDELWCWRLMTTHGVFIIQQLLFFSSYIITYIIYHKLVYLYDIYMYRIVLTLYESCLYFNEDLSHHQTRCCIIYVLSETYRYTDILKALAMACAMHVSQSTHWYCTKEVEAKVAKLSEVLDLLLPGASEAICGAPSLHFIWCVTSRLFRLMANRNRSKLRFHPDRHQLHNVQWQGFGLVTA